MQTLIGDCSTPSGSDRYVRDRLQQFGRTRRHLKLVLRRRFAGPGLPAGKHFAEKADGTEAQSARKRLTTARADGLLLGAHRSKRPSEAIKASQRARNSSSISSGSDTVRLTSSRTIAMYCFLSRWIRVLTVPTPTPRLWPAAS